MVSKALKRLNKIILERIRPKIKVGFVGQGKHALANLYPALPYAGIEIVATCAKYNADFTDFRSMMDSVSMDGVIACVNGQIHYEVAMEAVKRKLPVFLEKPPCLNSKQAEKLLPYKNKIMVGFNKRYAPIYMEAHRLIPHPESITINISVGKLKNKEELWREVGIHYVDLMYYFGGSASIQISDFMNWTTPTEHIEILGKSDLVVLDNANTITHYKPTSSDPGEIPSDKEKTTIWKPNYNLPVKENQPIFLNGYVGELRAFAESKFTPNIEDGYKALLKIEELCKQK